MASGYVEFAIIGGLREDYFILPTGEVRLRELGGNAVYAAAGARIWSEHVGLISRVGSNFPAEWLRLIQTHGIDTAGVKVLPSPQDTRTFYAYLSLEERVDQDPAQHFARIGQPLPPALEGYVTSTEGQDDRIRFTSLAVRPSEIPRSYFHARGFHLAPYDFLVHSTLPASLRREHVQYITCDPSIRYMQPAYAEEVRRVVHGLDAFLPSEMEARSFLDDPAADLWQAADCFGDMGARIVVLKLGARGQFLLDTASRRKWHIPAYPARVRDVTGAGDAYCGGFLAGLALTHDPVEAALRGSVAASLVIEGVGALYALSGTPGLAEARLNALRDSVRQI